MARCDRWEILKSYSHCPVIYSQQRATSERSGLEELENLLSKLWSREWAAPGTGGHGCFFCCCYCSWPRVSFCTAQSIQDEIFSFLHVKINVHMIHQRVSLVEYIYLVCLLEKETCFVWSAFSKLAVQCERTISKLVIPNVLKLLLPWNTF